MAQKVERRLAAILATDMVGYSRLMEADEAGTIARQKAHREALIDRKIAEHNGRIVKSTGDGLLVEFASVVDAVACAAEMQRAMAEREAEVPEATRIRYRVGINLGDIVIDGDDILGEGVNVAARLEGLADPGGICISDVVWQSVEGKLDLDFEDLGEQKVKNIKKPVRVYRVRVEPSAGTEAGVSDAAPALPAKPSIAVLPFENLTGDPEQEYVSDGISENIIASLSKVSEILVIARNSTFTYKGKPVKVQRVAEELGVRYVLEGSVQRAGEQIRVTAQLIDAVTGHHLWSERYDRRLEDLFAVQDDITREIVVALQIKLSEGEQGRMRHRSTSNLQAWGHAVTGYTLYNRYTKADNARAREQFERAVELDPEYAWAWVWLAWTYWIDARFNFVEDRAASFERSVEMAHKALALDDTLPDLHGLLSGIYWVRDQYDEAIAAGDKAIALDPNSAEIHANLAVIRHSLGQWDAAIALTKSALRLHPHFPSWYLTTMARAHAFKGEYDLAVARAEEGLSRAESETIKAAFRHILVFAHMEAGREEDARRHMAGRQALSPSSIERYRQYFSFEDPAHLERFIGALRKAGPPEK